MKPPPFRYHAPRTVADALRLAGELPNARFLAGGQSLMPMLNMRLVSPDHLIDLGRIDALSGIREDAGEIVLGAMTRQREIERSPLVRSALPLLSDALAHVGHRQTRNRGTIGGSLCHLDPSAEQPTVALAMEARLGLHGPKGRRQLAMGDFAVDLMTTALGPGEILEEIRIRPWPKPYGWAFLEFARRRGDFAIACVAVLVALDAQGRVARSAISLGGIAVTPVRAGAAEERLRGGLLGVDDIEAAARLCGALPARSDPHAPASYRQRLAHILAARALALAAGRAREAKEA